MTATASIPPRRVAGCDLGKAAAKFVIAVAGGGGGLEIESTTCVDHHGRPLEAFREWYRRVEAHRCSALAATGLYADELIGPALGGLPEDACLEAALGARPDLGGPLNLVSVGARGYAVLSRDERGRCTYVENEKCSSGTGETMVRIAGRFGFSLEEADERAWRAGDSIPITARCSVFAKSEMTHFGNQGRPADLLFRGYFESVARYVAALLKRVQVTGPVYLVGGGSALRAFARALGECAGVEAKVDPQARFFEALGACWIALEEARARKWRWLPDDPDELLRPRERRYRVLAPAKSKSHLVTRQAVTTGGTRPADIGPTVLGLDLGSTGSKAILARVGTGEVLKDVYDRTRGNPVEAARRLVLSLLERNHADVRAIGVTGSGREAVATVLRAAYPDFADRIVVLNEIVAHATAAVRCDDRGGESLSVVEIGGQDAKFIQIVGGQIVESDMNKACSAGTGSFLEEQGILYGIEDITEFARLAETATRPPDLGQMCTVFVAEAAAEARGQGFDIPDLCAGFMYSVIHNYLHRVMGSRTFGQRIFFQGKPATSSALAWTLAAVTGREVIIPPNPGAMGAWGVVLCALKQIPAETLRSAAPLDLGRFLQAEVTTRTEFQCKDPKCETLCRIEKSVVAVSGATQTVFAGGSCPKFEISTLSRPKLPAEAPSAFDAREALLLRYLEPSSGARCVGIPQAGVNCHLLPWLVTLVREWGFGAHVLQSDGRSLGRGEERCYSYDACAPAKIAHGLADAEVDLLFFPKILSLGDRDGGGGVVCAIEQGLPEVVEHSLRARGRDVPVVRPRLDLRRGIFHPAVLRALVAAGRQLGVSRARVLRSAARAAKAQRRYEDALAELGERTLAYGREHEIPVVVLCGSLHVIHERALNAGIPAMLRQNGVLALPMDCFPVPADVHPLPKVAWADARRALRTALACRERGGAFPLLLSSFGCGPASFAEHVFNEIMAGYPHTALETDGHGGTAGYVTRVQAFLHAVRMSGHAPSPLHRERLSFVEPTPVRHRLRQRETRIVLFSMADRLTPVIAAAYRSMGLDAVASGPNSEATFACGRRDCSGKECIPYQLIWGAFRHHLEQNPPQKPTLLLEVYGEGMCRNCMFVVKDRIALRRLGLGDRVSVRDWRPETDAGRLLMPKIWAGAVAWDILNQLAAYHRAQEPELGAVDRLYEGWCNELLALIERPMPRRGRIRSGWRGWLELNELVERAAKEFADLARRGKTNGDARTVFLSGDVYTRLDDFGSDGLVKKLNRLGLSVIVEPASTVAEYLVHERSAELIRLPTGRVNNHLFKLGMAWTRGRLYGRVRPSHPWLPVCEPRDLIGVSRTVLDRNPIGEAPVTIGSVLHTWRSGGCDGVVVNSPWGCGPALISESLLRHQREIPMLFVYNDGLPIDVRRLNSFAFRLRRQPPRTCTQVGP